MQLFPFKEFTGSTEIQQIHIGEEPVELLAWKLTGLLLVVTIYTGWKNKRKVWKTVREWKLIKSWGKVFAYGRPGNRYKNLS